MKRAGKKRDIRKASEKLGKTETTESLGKAQLQGERARTAALVCT